MRTVPGSRDARKQHPTAGFTNNPDEVPCVCGHTPHWHGTGGRGSCERSGECDCPRYSPATPETPANEELEAIRNLLAEALELARECQALAAQLVNAVEPQPIRPDPGETHRG